MATSLTATALTLQLLAWIGESREEIVRFLTQKGIRVPSGRH